MQKTKRPLSFLLAVLMIVSMFAAAPFSALAVPEGTPLTDQLPSTQGTYYLTQDITISSTWLAPSGATTLDLNGYGIRMTGTGTVIDVCRDASCVLTLNDSRPTYSGGENRPSGILGGYITGGTGSKDHPGTSTATYILGGGIYVNNAVLNINGGTITGNSAAWGGGIYIYNDCTVNMTGGAITGNSCARGGYGGGVFLSATSTFNVSHTPSITGNYSSYSGNKVTKNVHMQVVYSGGKPLNAVITIVSPGLTAGAQIGIYEYQTNAYPVTSGYSTYHSGVNPGTYFSCDNAGWAYKVNSEGELLSVPAFTITWLNEDGSLIDTTTVAGGTAPTHDAATKDATAQYTYTFAGWSDGTTTYAPDDALPEVIRNATYTATFTQTDREYTITWKNDDGSVIDTTTVPYGTVPTHADATKDADAQYSYTFAGWDKEIVAVTGDATYTATFTTSASPAAIVIGKIDAIGTVEYTDACKEKIDAAKAAFDALTDAQKALVTNSATLQLAEGQYAALQLAADMTAFEAYKTTKKSAMDALLQEGDSEAVQSIVGLAKTAIDGAQYDESKTLDENKAALDTLVANVPNAVAEQRAADKLAADKAAFEAYKAEKKTAVEAMAKEGDSTDAQQIIADAAAAIDALTYAEAKTLAENKAAVDAAADIADALAAQRATDLYAAKIEFDHYKAEQKAAVEAMAQEGDSEAVAQIIAEAAAAIDALIYDEFYTLAENKATVDTLANIADRLAAQRAADKLAADKAAFDAYKFNLVAAVQAMAQDGDSEAAAQIIADAAAAIALLDYDTAKTLDENKAAVDALADIAEALAAQRAADAVAAALAAAKEQLTGAVNTAKAFYDTIKDVEKYATIADTLDTAIQQGEAMLNSDSAADILAKAEQVLGVLASVKEQKDTIDATPTDEPTNPTEPTEPTEEPTDEPTKTSGACELCGKTTHSPHWLGFLHAVIIFVRDLFTKVFVPAAKLVK